MSTFNEFLYSPQGQSYGNIMDALAAFNQAQQQSYFGTPSPTPTPAPAPAPEPAPLSYYSEPTPTPTPTPEPGLGFLNLTAPAPNYSDIVNRAYTNILNRPADVGGSEYWTSQLASGKISPADFESRFRSVAAPEIAVQQLYQDVLKRPFDVGGLQHWVQEFGPDISPEERAKFIEFAQPELQARGLAGAAPAPAPSPAPAPAPSPAPEPASKIYDRDGNAYDSTLITKLADQIKSNLGDMRGGIYSTKGESVGFGFDEATKLLGRAPSAGEQVLLDMARNLASQGVTDINQLNIKDIQRDLRVTQTMDESGVGDYYINVPTGFDPEGGLAYETRRLTDEEIKKIQQREGFDPEGSRYVENILPGVTSGKGLYAANKLLSETYGDLDSLSYSLGGTYSGPGKTGYQIVINPQTGRPQFTTFGADTGDSQAISAALTIASFVPGPIGIAAQSANALWAASQGNVAGAVATFAGMNGYGNVASAIRIADAIDKGDPFSIALAIANNPNMPVSVADVKLAGNISVKDVANAVNLVKALNAGNFSDILSSTAALKNSLDPKTSSTAKRVEDAINAKDFETATRLTSELESTLAAADKITDPEVIKTMGMSAIDSTVADSGDKDVKTAVYNNAINAGFTESQAQNMADVVDSVIQYPGSGMPTTGTQVAAAPSTTMTDVTAGTTGQIKGTGREPPLDSSGMYFDVRPGDETSLFVIDKDYNVVDKSTGEVMGTIPQDRRSTFIERTGTAETATPQVSDLSKPTGNFLDKIKNIGALFSTGTSDPSAEKFAVFGSGASGGDPNVNFAIFAKDQPTEAIKWIDLRVNEALSDPKLTDAEKADISTSANTLKSQISSTSASSATGEASTSTGGSAGSGTSGGGTDGFGAASDQVYAGATTTPSGVESIPIDISTVKTKEGTGTTPSITPLTGGGVQTLPITFPAVTSVTGVYGPPVPYTIVQGPSTGTTGTATSTTGAGPGAGTEGPGAGVTGITGPGAGGGDGAGIGTGVTGPGPGGGVTGSGGGPTGPGEGPTGPTGQPTGTTGPTGKIPPIKEPPKKKTTPALMAMLSPRTIDFLESTKIRPGKDIKLYKALEEITGGLTPQTMVANMSPEQIQLLEYIEEQEEKKRRLEKEQEEDVQYAAASDVEGAKEGGLIDHKPEFYSEGGASTMANRYVRGAGDGTSDSVPAMLASGEFVIPADVVSGLGNGDNNAGAKVLDKFMEVIRVHKRSAAPNQLPEDSRGPLAYLEEALTKARKKKRHGRTK